jgi:hypothetical protein
VIDRSEMTVVLFFKLGRDKDHRVQVIRDVYLMEDV